MSTITCETIKKITTDYIRKQKSKNPITVITAYDALFAKIFDKEVDMILVGDSLNMSFFGKNDTISATMDMMIYHTKAVCNGAKHPLIIFDMPFGTYNTKAKALENAIRVYRESDADAVKIEGGIEKADIIRELTSNSIAVVGHIGLMPQRVRCEGGYKVKGKSKEELDKLILDAKAIEEAGAFCIVVEGVAGDSAELITQSVSIPTIGIGAGKKTDGQVLVWSDMFGFFEDFKPKFVKRYLNGAKLIRESVREYVSEVKTKKFPSDEYTY